MGHRGTHGQWWGCDLSPPVPTSRRRWCTDHSLSSQTRVPCQHPQRHRGDPRWGGHKGLNPARARSAAGISIASHISSARDRHRSMGLGQRERQPSGCPPPPLPRTASAGKPPELPRLLQRGVLAAPHLPLGVFAKRLLQPLERNRAGSSRGLAPTFPTRSSPRSRRDGIVQLPPTTPAIPQTGTAGSSPLEPAEEQAHEEEEHAVPARPPRAPPPFARSPRRSQERRGAHNACASSSRNA